MAWPRRAVLGFLLAAVASVASAQTEYAETPVETPAATRTLVQVRILGLDQLSEDDVRAMIRAREWGPYTPEDRARDESALKASGRFSSVSLKEVDLSTAAFRLDVALIEGPAAPPAGAEEEALSPPWVLGEVGVQGNRHVKAATIRAQIKARPGDLYQRADLDKDVQSVLALGQFDRVAADIAALKDKPVPPHYLGQTRSSHTIKLTLMVVEKPVLRKLAFKGNAKMSKGRLIDAISLRAKDPFDRAKLREDEEKILELYRSKGYHMASVSSEVSEDTGTHHVDVSFLLSEGPKARIGEVAFVGVTAFKTKKIAKQMKNRRRKVFSEKQLPEDLKKVEAFYKNRGYLDFKIDSSSFAFSPDNTRIDIAVAVTEGNKHLVGDTVFSGHSIYTSTELARAVEYRKGKIFSQEKFDFTLRGIQEMYADRGRLHTRIEPTRTFNPATGLTDVKLEIEEGGVSYVGHVDVEGNKATKTYVLKREVVVKPGQMFSMSKVQKSRERIMNLRFIDEVGLDIQPSAEPDQVDLVFEVFEGKPGMLTAGAGFSSLDGLVGTLSLQHLNLFGRAQQAAVQWSFGSRVQDYSVSWTSPWLNNKPTSLGLDVFNTRRISPFDTSGTAFTSRRTGGGVRLGPRFQDDKYQLFFNYTIQKIEITNVEQRFLGTITEGSSVQSQVGVEAAVDTRDSIWDPTRGQRHSVGMNVSGGPFQGNIHYFKPFLANSSHHKLLELNGYPLVLSFIHRGGYVTQFGETKEVPVFERFYIGGQDSLRGYSVNGEAGARDGGRVYDIVNVELGFPLARERKRTIVKFVTFFDAGGSWDSMRSVRGRFGTGEHDLKMDVGFGIRFTTPAFPIRLDWGYGLNHRPGEQKYQINFGIGNLF